jgi:hypothetical protein
MRLVIHDVNITIVVFQVLDIDADVLHVVVVERLVVHEVTHVVVVD